MDTGDMPVTAKASTSKTKKKARTANLCDKCTALCCRYFALPIDTPEDWEDYDDIRWYLCHENVTVFVEDGDWYLNVNNKCRHIDPQTHRCRIYPLRPKICRSYKTDNCDYTGEDYEYELHFTNDRQMEEYMRIKFGDKVFQKLQARQERKKRKKKKLTP